MDHLAEIDLLQTRVEDKPTTPPSSYDTTTVDIHHGIHYLCNTKCTCGRKLIMHVEVANCLIKKVFGEWWVLNPTGPDGNMSIIPCPKCRPSEEDRQIIIQLKAKKTKKIRLPGLEAVEKYQRQNAEHNNRDKPAPT